MNILDLVVGKPIKTSDERAEQIGPTQGIPIFGLDALSSAAYGPEAALTLLIPLGLLGVRYIVPVSAAIITLLVIVYFSYRQTIAAYPSGGGSYTVARFNLGASAGLLAAAALLADYILTAAVGISAGGWCSGLGSAVVAAVYRLSLRGDSDRNHHHQPSGRARGGRGLCSSYISVCGDTSDHHRRGHFSCAAERRASHAGCRASASAGDDCGCELLAAVEGFRQRMYSFDWRGGGQ
jgi:hypothetical protein